MTEITLKGGHTTADPRLDRVPQFDERSRLYGSAAVVPPKPLVSRSWPCSIYLDQGQEGACTGFSMSHALATAPKRKINITNTFATRLYKEAQKVDDIPGEDYEGSSVLAAAKVAQTNNFISEYRWAFGIDDALQALSFTGPVVFGIDWLDSMFDPSPEGLLDCSGKVAGGHAIMARGHLLKKKFKGIKDPLHVVRFRNSWGESWGVRGDCFIKVEDLDALLKQAGEACVPVGNKLNKSDFPL